MKAKILLIGALVMALVLSGCGFQPPPATTLWADVHPQGWVVFTGSRPPFPPPSRSQQLSSYKDDKILLFHPDLGTAVTLLQAPEESFSWPRWDSTNDLLYWIAGNRRVYRLTLDFSEIERAISKPLQSRLPLALSDAQLVWTEKLGTIQALAPSPDGQFVALLRERDGFSVVVLDMKQEQKIAELPTMRLPQISWAPDSSAVLLAREDSDRSVSLGNQQVFRLGKIVRHELLTGEERTLVENVAFFEHEDGAVGPGSMALSRDGATLYYLAPVMLRPHTAAQMRLGLYKVELEHGTRQLVMEFPMEEAPWELAAAFSGRRLAFTVVSYRGGRAWVLQSALYLYDDETEEVRRLAQLSNGWLFPLWLDDDHLAYVQFQIELEDTNAPSEVRPALWVYDVKTEERVNYLPLVAMQAQMESLRTAIRQLQEQIRALEQAVQELQAQINR